MVTMEISGSSRIKVNQKLSREITIFLDNVLGSPDNYRDELWTIINAQESDDIVLVMNTVGGDLSTALAFREALQMSHAPTTAIIMNECASGGTIIALSCENVGALDSCEFMIHTGKSGIYGNINNIKDYGEFQDKQINKLIEKVYSGFLSKQEIADVILGKELWFDADDTRQRLQNRAEYMERKSKPAPRKRKTKKEETTLLLG